MTFLVLTKFTPILLRYRNIESSGLRASAVSAQWTLDSFRFSQSPVTLITQAPLEANHQGLALWETYCPFCPGAPSV